MTIGNEGKRPEDQAKNLSDDQLDDVQGAGSSTSYPDDEKNFKSGQPEETEQIKGISSLKDAKDIESGTGGITKKR